MFPMWREAAAEYRLPLVRALLAVLSVAITAAV